MNPTFVEEADAIRELSGEAHLVGDHQHGQFVLVSEPADDVEDFPAEFRV